MISFIVPGKPHGKQSVQTALLLSCSACSRRGCYWKRTPSNRRICECGCDRLFLEDTQEYTPHTSDKTMNDIATFARLAWAGAGFTEPSSKCMAVEIRPLFEIPKYRRKELEDGEPHGQRPDADNICKSTLDGIKRGLLVVDDCQVSDLIVRKRWSSQPSRLEVSIEGTT